MSPEQTVNAFIAAVERGDLEGALSHLSPDCEYDNVPMSKAIGTEEIRGVLAMFVSPDQKTEFEIVRQAASGDLVMNERIDRLQIGDKHVELAVAGVFEVRDGRIVLWRDYFDLATLTGQMA